MKVFVSIFIVTSLVFIYTLFNTGLSRRLRPNGEYTEAFQNGCAAGGRVSWYPSPLLFVFLFIIALFATLSLNFSGK